MSPEEIEHAIAFLLNNQAQNAAQIGAIGVRLDQLTDRLDQMTDRLDQMTDRLDQITDRLDQVIGHLDQVTDVVVQLTDRVARTVEGTAQLTAVVDRFNASAHQRMVRIEDPFSREILDTNRRFDAFVAVVSRYIEHDSKN